MGFRSIKMQLEARLESRAGGLFSKPSGKLERKWYRDGGERLKIRVGKVKAPDGESAIVTADGAEIARLPLSGGSAKLDERADGPGALPALAKGQTIEVRVRDEVVLAGVLEVD